MQTGAVTFTRLNRVTYGEPVAKALAAAADRAGAARVFIMASQSLVARADEIGAVAEALGDRFCGLYSGMPAHTPRDAVLEAAAGARLGRADMIATVGGGSITDAAKAVTLALEHDLTEIADFDPFILRTNADGTTVAPEYRAPTLPLVCCPTTLSAGEYNPLAGVSDPRKGVKQAIRSLGMAPSEVILDPALTLPTPEWLWLSTGVRAVDHCVEAVCSHLTNAYCDAQSLHGLTLLTRGLTATRADPLDLEARMNCQLGAWLSMSSVQANVPKGASHAIGHILGGSFGVAHGHTSCVMLPLGDALEPGSGHGRPPETDFGRHGRRRSARRRPAGSFHQGPRHADPAVGGRRHAGPVRAGGEAFHARPLDPHQSPADQEPGSGAGNPETRRLKLALRARPD